jgi:hypothetical protein
MAGPAVVRVESGAVMAVDGGGDGAEKESAEGGLVDAVGLCVGFG